MIGTTNFKVPQTMFFLEEGRRRGGGGRGEGEREGEREGKEKWRFS